MWAFNKMVAFVPVFVYLLTLFSTSTYGQLCTMGQANPSSKKKTVDAVSGQSVLLNDAEFQVGCTCGFIYEWQFYAKTNTGDLYLQVWRNSGSTWTLVGQNIITVTNAMLDQTNTATIPASNRILVKLSDYLGIYAPGLSIVTYDNGQNYKLSTTVGTITVGSTHPWGSEPTTDNKRDYGLRAFANAGSPPQFDSLPKTETIFDSVALNTLVHTIQVSDPDTSEYLTLVTTMTSTSTYFSFDSSTLQVKVQTSPPAATYTLNFQVKDGCDTTTTGTLTITVQNSVPVITSLPGYASIREDLTTETLLHTLATTDASPVDTISCSVAASSPASTNFLAKLIPLTTNYGIYSKSSPTYDYKTQKRYTLTVNCVDGHAALAQGTFRVFVTDNQPPGFTNLQGNTTVSQSSTGNNALVYSVVATDVENDPLTYSMTCSEVVCPFTINSLAEIKTTSSLAGTTTVGYDLFISVNDGRTTTGPKSLTVKISDINTVPIITNLPLINAITIEENTAVGTTIYTVSTKDADSSQTITYSAKFDPLSGSTLFAIAPATGAVTIIAGIDYEIVKPNLIYNISATASDGQASDTETLLIEILNVNEAPVFGNPTYYLVGNEGDKGLSYGTPTFVTTDPDGDTLTYSVSCPEFHMDSTTTEVTLSIPYDLDIAGTASTVTCITTATDGDLSATTTLSITVNQLNDNSPKFGLSSYIFSSSIYSSVNDVIGSIAATDADIGMYGTFYYTLDQSSLSNPIFNVKVNGDVFISMDIGQNLGSGVAVSFTANVTDTGGLSDTTNIFVVVQDTTTAASTTTTERYITFIEAPSNVAWLTSLLIALFASIVMIAGLIYFKNICQPVYDLFSKIKPEKKKMKIKKNKHDSERKINENQDKKTKKIKRNSKLGNGYLSNKL